MRDVPVAGGCCCAGSRGCRPGAFPRGVGCGVGCAPTGAAIERTIAARAKTSRAMAALLAVLMLRANAETSGFQEHCYPTRRTNGLPRLQILSPMLLGGHEGITIIAWRREIFLD